MTDASIFDHPKPAFSHDEVARRLAADYGLTGRLTDLVSERDQNLRLSGPDGDVVVKIANLAEDLAQIDLQAAVLAHIAAVDPDLGVQRVVPTRAGADRTVWEGPGGAHAVRVLTWLPGQLMSAVPATPALLAGLGDFMGRLSAALAGFGHPAAHRPGFLWNLDEVQARRALLADVAEPHRAMVGRILDRHAARVLPVLGRLRAAVIHQDANDNNIVVPATGSTGAGNGSGGTGNGSGGTGNGAGNGADAGITAVSGLIDFGDMTFGRQVNELAVTLAYALLDQSCVYAAARPLIAAYARRMPLTMLEATVLFDLVAARLAASVLISSHRARAFPDNAYLTISQAPALRLLDRLDRSNPDFLAAVARQAAGHDPAPAHDRVVAFLTAQETRPHPLFDFDPARAGRFAVALRDGAPGMEHGGDPAAYEAWLEGRLAAEGARYALGLYGEDRDVYRGDQFATPASPEWRSRHLGIDVFIAAGTPLLAPLPGRVHSVADNALPYDYGPTIILEHQAGEGGPLFHTLYGHLGRESLAMVRPGDAIAAGQPIGVIGAADVNGGWSPHLHFQIITDLLGQSGEFPGVGQPSLWEVWRRISPDPNLILRLAPESFAIDPHPPEELLARRAQVIGPSLSISYARKLKIVRGRGAWLYDHTGRAFLDGVNNICHVGHSHPRVVEALARQAAVLNTNTRYLHDGLITYAERLGGLFPDPLKVVFMVCSGSEANELALRIARTVTGRRDTICVDWGYHGNTNALIEVSPYKFNRKGGRGRPEHVEIAVLPDPYRGPHRGSGPDAARAYAASVEAAVERIRARTGEGPAAFIAEAISGCGGQVFFPDGYLAEAARHVRAAGGLVIVDEVQTGFGRVGDHMWAHGTDGVVPDIVTLGKPIGNGHPMAAVVTTPEIARAFANGMEFFSSFGGNPVSAAVGMAVLDVLEEEGLMARARLTGDQLKARLRDMATRHRLIGDVRGRGLFLGVELVLDHESLEPATQEAGRIANLMREDGVLVSTDGPADNVLKIKPPMAFGPQEADIFADSLERALAGLRR